MDVIVELRILGLRNKQQQTGEAMTLFSEDKKHAGPGEDAVNRTRKNILSHLDWLAEKAGATASTVNRSCWNNC